MITRVIRRAMTANRFAEIPLSAKLKDAKSSLNTPLEVR